MKNWYDVTVVGRIDRYGVDKTVRMAVESRCEWTKETITPAIVDASLAKMQQASEGGISDIRVTEFAPLDAKPDKAEWCGQDAKFVSVLDIDLALKI